MARPRPGTADVRVARIIARLNIGGPAIQAITLTSRLEPLGYETLLIRGTEAAHEGSMDDLADAHGVHPLHVPAMRREINPGDARAFAHLVRVLRRFRPHIVHTHAAKAGALGRAAALRAGLPRPPLLVHTYHGHSLEGYFSARKAAIFVRLERALARRTAQLVAVSDEVRADLVRLGIAPDERLEEIPLGFDLQRFAVDGDERARRAAAVRHELGVPDGAPLVTLLARLVPIKRVDRFLEVAARVAAERPDAHFAIVGDGELRERLHGLRAAAALVDRLHWTGFRRDVADVCFASAVVTLTSDNEGTPVSLIEAQAAGVPVVGTRVGGAATVVCDGLSGRLVAAQDVDGFARAVVAVLADPVAARAMGEVGRRHVLDAFSLDRLVADVDRLYRRLLVR